MLGISVYLGQDIAKQAAYIEKMNEHGFQSIFTSLHIPEDDHAEYEKQLKKLGQLASDLNMELMADISSDSLKTLGLDWSNAETLLDWGLTGLRIDYGIDDNTIIELSKKMRIALNASTISLKSFREMREQGLMIESVEAWHNFYPRPETGLGLNDFIEQNHKLKEEGLTVMAFIPGDEMLRGPLYEKLPTLEKHRHLSPFAAFLEMKYKTYVDKILIGDQQISFESLAQFSAYTQGVILLRANSDKQAEDTLIERATGIHTNRPDVARDMLRSVESRQNPDNIDIQPGNCAARPAGTITIDNVNYLRYQGEIQVTVNDLPADEKVNVIGRVIPEDRPLLKRIRGNEAFKIKWL